jgi:hypothetical protein
VSDIDWKRESAERPALAVNDDLAGLPIDVFELKGGHLTAAKT